MREEEGWLIPERSVGGVYWRFGTRHAVLRNEVAYARQVHGAAVLAVTQSGPAGEGDALITSTPGVMLGIRTADCLPILIADTTRKCVAAVHAGWRGTAQGVVAQAVERMMQMYGTKPIDLLVVMGPAIGQCCFEVGAEVAREFTKFDPELGRVTGKCYLDLQAINAHQLEQLGINPSAILKNNLCTMCGVEKFWSYRREGVKAGRLWAVVKIEEEQ